jgi:uncharacterized RDD family membrane protein YckC
MLLPVQPYDPDADLVVSTPERVAFQYPVAGPGSRFLAQLIDQLVLTIIVVAVIVVIFVLGVATNDRDLTLLLVGLASFVIVFFYFLISEAMFGGQTVGKRALRLRVVGDQGQPITFSQALIRNLVRVVDFLPVYYGVGLITLFINGRGKRLGDLAAGTVVVREQGTVNLRDLAYAVSPAPVAPSASSIWAQPAVPTGQGVVPPPTPAPQAPPEPSLQLEPDLKRFVIAYASRRAGLDAQRRATLAKSIEPALRKVLPAVVESQGPLAALEQLATAEAGPGGEAIQVRQQHPDATPSLTFGIVSVATFGCSPVGILFGILALLWGNRALRDVGREPERWDMGPARTGRVLGTIGLALGVLVTLGILGWIGQHRS